MNTVSNSSKFIISRQEIQSLVFIILAVLSFFPSLVFVLLFLLLLSVIYFHDAGIKYLFFISLLILLTLFSMLWQQEFFYKGPLLSSFFLLPFLLFFLFSKNRNISQQYVVFMKVHIYLSLLQIPLQFIQFINAFGFDFTLLLHNSSSGDVSFGMLYNAFVLADKQLLSMFFLFSLKNYFSKKFFLFGIFMLFFSFMFIGANTTALVFILSVLVYIIISSFNLKNLKDFLKKIMVTFLLLIVFFISTYYLFNSQYKYINSSIDKAIENVDSIGKVKAFKTIVEIFEKEPAYLMFGLGSGYYSSRISYILSGEYLWQGEHPLLGIQNNKRFDTYLRPLWNDDIRFNIYLNSTMYQPFSGVLTIISEYGLIVFSVFIVLLFNTYKKIKMPIGKVFVIFISGMLILDNFIEYPRLLVPVLIYILYLRSLNNSTFRQSS